MAVFLWLIAGKRASTPLLPGASRSEQWLHTRQIADLMLIRITDQFTQVRIGAQPDTVGLPRSLATHHFSGNTPQDHAWRIKIKLQNRAIAELDWGSEADTVAIIVQRLGPGHETPPSEQPMAINVDTHLRVDSCQLAAVCAARFPAIHHRTV